MSSELFIAAEPQPSIVQLTSHIIQPWDKNKYAIECLWGTWLPPASGITTHLVFGEKLKKKIEAILDSPAFQTNLPKLRIFKEKDDYKVVVL